MAAITTKGLLEEDCCFEGGYLHEYSRCTRQQYIVGKGLDKGFSMRY